MEAIRHRDGLPLARLHPALMILPRLGCRLSAVMLLCLGLAAHAQTTAPAAPTPPAAPGASAAPSAAAPPPAPTVPAATPAPGAVPAPATAAHPAAKPAEAPALTPGGLGEQLVGETGTWLGTLGDQFAAAVRAASGLHAMLHWVRRAQTDPELRARVLDAALKATFILALGAVAEAIVSFALRRFRRAFDRAGEAADYEPQPDETVLGETHVRVRAARSLRLLRRLPGALLRAVLAFLPAVAFALATNLLLGLDYVQLFTTKMIIVQATNTWLVFRAVTCVGRLLFTDKVGHWRLIDPGDAEAAFLDRTGRMLAGIAIFGTALAEIAGRLGLAVAAQQGLLKLFALVVHIGLVFVIWRLRAPVARRLRPRGGKSGMWRALASGVAQSWHWIAIAVVVLSWPFWAFQQLGGISHMLRLVLLTVLVLIVWRVLAIAVLGLFDRMFRAGTGRLPPRARRYYAVLRRLTAMLLGLIALLVLLATTGVHVLDWFTAGALGARVSGALGTVVVIAILALAGWEFANASIDHRLETLTATGHFAQAGRLRTLQPLLRTCLMIAIAVLVGLTALSELGINTGPLLAGAGIFGVALGFGSQRLVQDFITGIFLLLENAMQVGEWVTVSGLSGTVEHLSIRTIRLRAGDGSVHIIPFSSVTIVTNTNRGIGNAAVNVTVSAEEDVDRVATVIKQIGAELQDDPDYRAGIRSALVLWGVDKLDATTVTLAGQIECTDAARWGVQREFNRRVKYRFAELGIRLANPATAVLLEEQAAPRPAAWPAVPAPGGAATSSRSPAPAALGNSS